MGVIDRLSTASLRRVIDPDVDLPGKVGNGQVLPDELLAMHELAEFADLSSEQRARLSREEVASIVEAGLRFEAVLMAGFALDLVDHPDLTHPEVVYALHEIGEETRHSRLFSRLLGQLAPTAQNPLARFRPIEMRLIPHLIRRPATLDVLVLGGEEIPDLLQKRACEHPDTDPFLRQVNRYHRAEEARHLSFARAVLPQRLSSAGAFDRFLVRHVVPRIIWGDVRHDRTSRRLLHRRPSGVRHVEARQPHALEDRAPARGDTAHRDDAAALRGVPARPRPEGVAATRRRRPPRGPDTP